MHSRSTANSSAKLFKKPSNIPKSMLPALVAKMHKAIAIMQFKYEAELIRRHPEFNMDSRLLLDTIDLNKGGYDGWDSLMLLEKPIPLCSMCHNSLIRSYEPWGTSTT